MADPPITPLREFYDALHALKEYEQTALAEAHAADPTLLAYRFRRSVEVLERLAPINEAFYPPGRKALPVPPPTGDPIRSTFDFAARLSDGEERLVRGADTLTFRYVDREIFPTRTTTQTQVTRLRRRSLDLLLANAGDRMPVFAELKIRGDRLPYFALVQLLMLAAELLASSHRDRLGEQYREQIACPTDPPFADLYIIAFEAPERGRYRARALGATRQIAERLMENDDITGLIRRIAYLDAFSEGQALEFAKVFAFGSGSSPGPASVAL